MAVRYSISRIQCFDNCRLQYKYRYIDRLEPTVETIERYMGKCVHKALECLYRGIKNAVIPDQEWLLAKYAELWKKNFHTHIKVVRQEYSADDYFNQGKNCLRDYFLRHHPFSTGKVVDVEYTFFFTLRWQGQEYPFCGVIDRLDWNDRDQVWEVHDYKTSGRLMSQQEADSDWQLGMYQIAVREKWPDAQKIKLVWHFLMFNKDIVSYRDQDQIQQLQCLVVDKIREIESCEEFLPTRGSLCEWCDYLDICPLWKHPREMERIGSDEYRQDRGVRLVERYAQLAHERELLQTRINTLEEEQRQIESAVIEFAQSQGIVVIDGPDAQLVVETKDVLRAPTRSEDVQRWEALRSLLIKEGRLQEVSTVNNNMINYRIRHKKWPPELIRKVKSLLKHETRKSVRLIKK